MQRKKSVLLYLILILTIFLNQHFLTQENVSAELKCTSEAQKDTDIIQKVQLAYKDVTSLRAKFHQTSFLAALDQSDESGGEVFFGKPGKMRWNYTYPSEQFFLVNDVESKYKKEDTALDLKDSTEKLKTVWFYQKEANQVMIDDFSEILISDAPVAFLMGIGDLSITFELLSSCNSEEGIILDLKERKREENSKKVSKLSKFKLLVDSSYTPIGAEVYDVGGNITSIFMDKVQKNVKIDDSVFKPDFPKGVDIVTR